MIKEGAQETDPQAEAGLRLLLPALRLPSAGPPGKSLQELPLLLLFPATRTGQASEPSVLVTIGPDGAVAQPLSSFGGDTGPEALCLCADSPCPSPTPEAPAGSPRKSSLHLYGFEAGLMQSCVCSPLSLVTSWPGVSPRVWPLSTWLLSLSPQLPCPF